MRSLSLHTSDGHALDADLAEASEPTAGVVVCHPHPLYGGNRFNPVVDAFFRALPAAGFTTIRFDFRAAHAGGVGERLDAMAALDELAEVPGPRFIVGYSFGAIVALTTADPRVTGIVAVAPPLTSPIDPPSPLVLVLMPRHDQVCPVDTASSVVGSWPNASFEVVEHADHFLVGHTAVVAERGVSWLTERVAASA